MGTPGSKGTPETKGDPGIIGTKEPWNPKSYGKNSIMEEYRTTVTWELWEHGGTMAMGIQEPGTGVMRTLLIMSTSEKLKRTHGIKGALGTMGTWPREPWKPREHRHPAFWPTFLHSELYIYMYKPRYKKSCFTITLAISLDHCSRHMHAHGTEFRH